MKKSLLKNRIAMIFGAILGLINDLPFALDVDHPLLRQGSPYDISSQVLHGGLVPRIYRAVDNLFKVWTPKPEFRRKAISVNPDEFFKILFDTTIPARRLGIAWSIDGWSAVHFSDEKTSFSR